MLEYHAAYYPIEDGWYMAVVLDFPGTVTQGKTIREARRMIRDALRMMAECTIEHGAALPQPDPKAHDETAMLQERLKLKPSFTAKASK